MEKTKLINTRNLRGLTQKDVADRLSLDVSTYNRKENGIIKVRQDEWDKLSEILSVPIEDIYESEESHCVVFKDFKGNAVSNYSGTNNIYSIPEFILENQRKYIEKLEEENERLRKELGK